MMSPNPFAIFLSLLVLIKLASAFQQGSKVQDAASMVSISIPEIKLDDSFISNSVSGSIQDALVMIEDAKALPSCPKIATSALMHSCSALEGSIQHEDTDLTRGTDLFVDEEADIYSARLAVCELSGAEFLVPKECQAFIPTEQITKKIGVRGYWSKKGPTEPKNVFQLYEEITQAKLQQCRKALGSTSQSWTSYSNNRQNAVVMCRAMRSEVEKDEQLHVGKVLAQAAMATTGSIQEALERANEMKAQFIKLATAMPQFQRDLAASNQQQLEHIDRFWIQMEELRAGLQDVLEGFSGVKTEISHTKTEVVDMSAVVRKAVEDSVNVRDVARLTKQEMKEVSDNTAAIAESSGYVVELVQQKIITGLYKATQNIDTVNAMMPIVSRELATWQDTLMLMHEESMGQQREQQSLINHNTIKLQQLNQSAHEFNATVASLSFLVTTGWFDAFELLNTAAIFASYVMVYTLLGFGVWERFAGFYFLGTVLASIGTGFVLAFISTYSFSPIDLYRFVSRVISNTVLDSQLAIGVLLGMILCFAIAAVRSVLFHLLRARDYDPASPPCPSTKWEV